MNDGSLLGDEQTQLDLRGPLEFDALLQTYYGFVENDGTSFLSSFIIGASGGTQVGLSTERGWLISCLQLHVWFRVYTYLLCITNLISQHYCSPMYLLLIMQHYWLHTVRACYIIIINIRVYHVQKYTRAILPHAALCQL